MPSLHWTGKDAAVVAIREVPYRPLVAVPDLSYGDPETENLLIQGDNLDALKSLLPVYAGRVKCVFIDPPYNTRSAFEHYDDNREHSIWLSMMYPRLELLRELLSEDGSIWVTIDDNEGHYLKVMMDEMFGRSNFVATAIWQKLHARNNSAQYLSADHDFVLAYAKNIQNWSRNKVGRTAASDADFWNPDDDARGQWRRSDLTAAKPYSDGHYEVVGPHGDRFSPRSNRYWSISRETFDELVADERIWWGKTGRTFPFRKRFKSELGELVPTTVWTHEEVGNNREAKQEITRIFGRDDIFSTPKPERLLQRILHIATDAGDLVLDSFLGSGTTAAVAHKMGRRWIAVEMGEHAETHCAARLRKVVEGEQGSISKDVNWQGGGGFRFCRLGEAVFDGHGSIRPGVGFADLARWVWYRETRQPLAGAPAAPLLGVHQGTAYYLLYNGILGDRRPAGGNVLTAPLLECLAPHDGPRVVFGEACRLHESRLTALNLRFRQLPYRERLNAQFGIDRVRVLSLEDATGILPQEVHQKALIVVSTTQALRVDKMDTRKVYAGHEGLDATFERLTVAPDMDTDEQGRVLASFVNLCRAWPPLVIVDEAHNARTPLSFDTLKRFAPAFILELTATPATDPKSGSNVLVRVSARELRDATMIKLPVVVTEYGGDWTATVAGAVRERAMLEDLAGQDGRGIRPIALYQAERKDGTVTPETIRAHLIKNEDIAEDEIAIATGTQRGIDGVDLFLPGCKIRHIITVQALKEGWDCAWAYVLCSVANIRSPKDIEQLLGRVLRMPNAQASRFDPLNRAYAHVTHGAFQTTAKQLRDALVTLGFDRDQAQEAVQTPFHFDEGDDLLAARRGTSVVLPGAPPNLDGLPGSDLAGIAITRQSPESTTLHIQPEAPPEAIDRLCERLPANQRQPVRDAYRQAVALRCPAERGETLTLPLLAWRQEELILGEATAEELRHHGRFSARDCPPHDCAWSNDRQATTSEIDADAAGHLRISEATVNLLPQRALSEQLDRDWLVYWLARECRRTDTTEPDMIAYLTGWVTHLERTHGLDALRVHKYRLQARLTQCLDQCALKAAERGLSDLFDFQDGADSPLTIAPEVFVGFRPETDYRPTKPLRGRVFRKHLYPVVGEMNRPETDVAAVLDSLPEVEVWLRNLDRHPRSFRLPCPSEHGDWFYPDFLGRLTDTRLLVTEYKGGYLEPFDSRKRQMGLAWQRAMNGQGVFLWIGDSAETSRGRSIAQQIQDGLRGSGVRSGRHGPVG